jgi:hypothetical protein
MQDPTVVTYGSAPGGGHEPILRTLA